jgi:hypothetical protein
VLSLLLAVPLLAGVAAPARADTVLDWNSVLLAAIRLTRPPPPMAARDMAIMNTAIYDAVNAASALRYRPYHYDGPPILGASADAAAAAAGYRILSRLFPEVPIQAPSLAARMQAIYDRAVGAAKAPAVAAGVALGDRQADAMLEARAHDGAEADAPPYLGDVTLGRWRPTPPGMLPGLLPQWPRVTPWTMTSAAQFRPHGPPPMTSPVWAGSLNMVQALGSAAGEVRGPERTEIALFWADNDGTETPPGHWLNIAIGVAGAKRLDLLQNARLMALLGTTEADAAIVAWDAKYAFSTWRPITAIAQAASSGNAEVTPQPGWTPLLATPPFPEYMSGHSTFSAAAATILSLYFGDDDIAFTARTDAPELVGVTRRFSSFSAAAEEAGMSRIYAGIHFHFSHLDGAAAGRSVANYVFDNYFQAASGIAAAVSTR